MRNPRLWIVVGMVISLAFAGAGWKWTGRGSAGVQLAGWSWEGSESGSAQS